MDTEYETKLKLFLVYCDLLFFMTDTRIASQNKDLLLSV